MLFKKNINLNRNQNQKRVIVDKLIDSMIIENYEILIDYSKYELIIRNEKNCFIIENFNNLTKNLFINSGLLYNFYKEYLIKIKNRMILE